jgi:hypothetical protein
MLKRQWVWLASATVAFVAAGCFGENGVTNQPSDLGSLKPFPSSGALPRTPNAIAPAPTKLEPPKDEASKEGTPKDDATKDSAAKAKGEASN